MLRFGMALVSPVCLRLQRAVLAAALLAIAVASLGLAAPNLDLVQSLAQERYGQRAASTVADWRKMLEEARGLDEAGRLEAVNGFFNRRVLFEDDIVVWKEKDYWASPLEFMGRGAGDCEDFSIAKYVSLLLLGVPNEKLRMIYVRARLGGSQIAHMVLGYYAEPTGEPMILDNLIDSIRPASRRPDLAPVFSFNNAGLWVPGASASAADPTARLSRWRDVLEKIRAEGSL
jgi:predicted transglutaminase-like cysteine proteinase